MAAPGGKYWIQDKLNYKFPHHNSFADLWDKKWKTPANMGVYPFMFSTYKDFEPVIEEGTKRGLKPPYNWDEYAEVFFPQGEKLANIAKEAESVGNIEKASEYYMRASAVYRIARFPAPRSEKQREAWKLGKECAKKGLSIREEAPVTEITIPHAHAHPSDGQQIPFYYHLPSSASESSPVPLVILMTGLDGYRTELAVWQKPFAACGVATIVIEIPGTGDSPADPSDPTSPEREWSSLFDWIQKQPGVDKSKVAIWAFSTGSYYGIRVAHTHPQYLAGVVANGGGCHHMFDAEWLDATNTGEYPFDLGKTLGYKFGYGNDFEKFKAEGSKKFSLLLDGTLDKPGCANLLLVNGTDDSIFPIDDYFLAIQHGDPKIARIVPGSPHMGEPQSFFIILTWLFKLFGVQNMTPGQFMSTVPFKPKY